MEQASHDDYEIYNGRKVVKKHVATIHCSNKLSLLERKISNALLYNAFPSLKENLIHEISLDKLKTLLNITTRNHKALKDALRKLISTLLEWNLLGDDVPELEGWNSSTILSSVRVTNGVVEYQYSELIKTLIIDPKIYGRINLIIQSRFKSSYALALYENCARYRGLKYTKTFTIDEFRALMGVEEGKYETFRDLHRRVITHAVNEVNTCSDIRVKPDIIKKAKKVQAIKFELEERKIMKRFNVESKKTALSDKAEIQKAAVFESPSLTGIPASTIKDYCMIYGKARVEKSIQYLKSNSNYKLGKIKNIAGYLRNILENDWCGSEEETQKTNNDKGEVDSTIEDEKINYFNSYLPATIYKLYQHFSEHDRKEIEDAFQKNGSKYYGKYIDIAQKKGTANFLIFKEGLASFIYYHFSDLLPSVFSLEEYIKENSKEVVV